MARVWSTTQPARQPPQEKTEEPVTVLVTGFGPFLDKFPLNTSWLLCTRLPALIPSSSHPSHLSPSTPSSGPTTPIRILIHPSPIRVSYPTVSHLSPTLLPPLNPIFPHPDIILHIGLAAGRNFYTLEEGAHREGYDRIPDVDGVRWSTSDIERTFPRAEFPARLTTRFHTSDILPRWQKNLTESTLRSAKFTESNPSARVRETPEAEYDALKQKQQQQQQQTQPPIPDVRLSPDAGNFLCGFIYYNTLANCYSLQKLQELDHTPTTVKMPTVAFLHVPDLTYSEEGLEEGKEVVVGLIKALVESLRTVGVKEGIEKGSEEREESGSVERRVDVNFRA
ncbi:peptidase C15, pyroglutamyl peptidase I-like protein [Delitschia confertaspora ATCC 74209]|uniref:Peptidase C15, pyroglutamyl peptidase I-like protein n=1 Tax=Delitschia confertaspora ATCC 74209 TaxID=1513339 RepID=A0A9P4JCW2_9PLEO|nr:peptidase C15, pyroglutamyl peptidase I-like protein [Delitschia confertaspora ATCC 74209]